VGLHEKSLRPKLQRLAEVGLIEFSFPRGHTGWFTVICYERVVHLGQSQKVKRPTRNGRSLRGDQGIRERDSRPATGESSARNGRNARSEQGAPVCKPSDRKPPRNGTPVRSTVSAADGTDDDDLLEAAGSTPREVANARRAMAEALDAARTANPPRGRRPFSSRAAHVSDQGADEEEDEDPITSSAPRSTPGRGVVQLAAHVESRSLGLREREPRGTVGESASPGDADRLQLLHQRQQMPESGSPGETDDEPDAELAHLASQTEAVA
jgi:hypothetical protein